MTENTQKILKFKDFRDFEVVEEKKKYSRIYPNIGYKRCKYIYANRKRKYR